MNTTKSTARSHLAKIALVGALVIGSQLGATTAATAATLAPSVSAASRIDAVRAPGLVPMYCKTIKVPPRDPWFLCLNIGNPGTTVAARCKPTYEVRCGY